MQRRGFLINTVAALLAPAVAGARGAWPERPITLVVPFGAGGSADLVARMFGQHFQVKYGIAVTVENKGGAGGTIGTASVARAAPDGYTLVLGTVSTHAINPALYARLPFNAETDFEPISPIVRLPNLLVINNKLPVKTVAELVAYLKANDGKVNFGSAGNGTSGHLSTVMFMKAIGVTMTHVPFRGTSDEMSAMVGGHIDLAIDSMTTIWPIAKSGEVRPLAVTTPQRVATAPDLPTIGETVPGFEAIGWQGLFAPAKTPPAIVEELAAEVKRIFLQPELVLALKDVGGEPLPMRPDEFARFVQSERVKWGAVVRDAGLRIE
ncbi:MAG: Bug family tripartite tricarboxylate transporter substrate binding protein [Xanthobacteraceae bacterium]